jgi:DNA repair photolyase
VRWDQLLLDPPPSGDNSGEGRLALALPGGIPGATVRTFDTPEFRGMTFYEVQAKTIINRVPASSRMFFEYTINPYRGCSHACVYCFARNTHTYLDLDAGLDFDSKVVVKVNAPALVRRELAAKKWSGAHIAMGTNVDCYQRAEGRYRLMPGILAALRDFGNPFSILTKGTLLLRDLDLLVSAARTTDVSLAVSVGSVDEALWRSVEPGTPAPRRRLDMIARLSDAGFEVSVLMAPVLPGLSDTEEHVDATVRAIVGAGAASIAPLGLHLRPGAREWYLAWLGRHHPHLLPRYRELYERGSYLASAYQNELTERVHRAARRHGLPPKSPRAARVPAAPGGETHPSHTQLSLL